MQQYHVIEWDEHNLYKNEETHGVRYWEIEEAFENPHIVLRGKKKKRSKKAENRKFLLGQTTGGRHLFIVFEDKGKGIVRPISARNMEPHERRKYEEKI